MKIYVVTCEKGEYEDIGYEQIFFNNKEKAYKYVYDFCLECYEDELTYQTKKESKKRKGEWEASHTIKDFEKEMAKTKKEWNNYNTVSKTFDSYNYYDEGVFAYHYNHHCKDNISMSIIEVK